MEKQDEILITASIDSFFLGEEHSEDTLPSLAVKDCQSQMISSHALVQKGVEEYAIKVLIADLVQLGYKRYILKNDQESATLALNHEVINWLQGREVIPEESPPDRIPPSKW